MLPGLNNGHVVDASVDATAQWERDKRKEAHDAQCEKEWGPWPRTSSKPESRLESIAKRRLVLLLGRRRRSPAAHTKDHKPTAVRTQEPPEAPEPVETATD